MARPKPTKQLILDMSGGNSHLVECMHHGLDELPMAQVYPALNLDEALAFAASSWKTRQLKPRHFETGYTPDNLYAIFSEVLQIGTPWVAKNRHPEVLNNDLYIRLNNLHARTLRERLRDVPRESALNFLRALQEPIFRHVFECQYQQTKSALGGDNSRIRIMNFQNVYPKSGRIVPAYAAEISRMIGDYPREAFEPQPQVQPQPQGQLNLF